MHNAELYQGVNVMQRNDSQLFIKKYASKINWKRTSNRILDIGSGDGGVTMILKSHIPDGCEYKVTGVDISEKMVKYANKHHRDENTTFLVLDITDNMPQDLIGSFDHVFSCYALHWVIDQEVAFRNIYKLLSDGGDCYLIILGKTHVFDIYLELQKGKWSSIITETDPFISPYHFVQEPEKKLRQLMADVGFVDIEVERRDMSYVYENMDIGKKALYSVCPYKSSDEFDEEFMKDYMTVAREFGFMYKPGDELPETIKLDHQLLVAFARKPSIN